MVARGNKTRSESPTLNLRVELDNSALRAKNNNLTQTVAKLQQDNAELVKQITLLQGESFEFNSKYNNLKNVISIIDSTTKTCLPKLNEVVETFTGIIQLCSVAANISNLHNFNSPIKKDTRTQAVKPQIVNGHILLNPTITLSRLSNENSPNLSARSNRMSDDIPSTSRDSDHMNDSDDDRDNQDNNEEQESSFVCKASRRSHRKQSLGNADMSMQHAEEFEDSDDEDEEEPMEEEESDEEEGEQRLTTIHEVEEEDDILDAVSPRSRQRRFLQGRLQEVRIYLNQLPNTYIEQFRGSGNISISVSPPERRSSFKHRSSSLVGDANESLMDNGRLYVDDQMNRSRMSQGEATFNDNSRLNLSFKSPPSARSRDVFDGSRSGSSKMLDQYSENRSAIQGLHTSSTVIHTETDSLDTESFQELDLSHFQLHRKTSTPMESRRSGGTMIECTDSYDSPIRSKNDSSMFKSNVTKRKTSSRDKKKVAKVLLNRISIEKRLSGSPIKILEGIVNLPIIRKSSEFKERQKSVPGTKDSGETNAGSGSEDDNVQKKEKPGKKTKRKRNASPRKMNEAKLKTKTSPPKSPAGRPKRAARPTKTLKEPNLTKKMRRSK